jgi:Na+-transporting NADH:ubiquinone oxidoreductase subunit A
VGLLGSDYIGMRPTMQVKPGDTVRRGQLLFEDKKMPGVRYTSPAAGKVVAVNRGEKRTFQSVVIELSRTELEGRAGGAEEASFSSFTGRPAAALTAQQVRDLLIESGLWTALRARPFSRVANPADQPHSVFVTAMDTQPLAPAASVVLAGQGSLFRRGLEALAKLTEGPVVVCTDPETSVELPEDERVRVEQFTGPHPAGTVGLHIHMLDPVDRHKVVWHLSYQDAIAVGHLFDTGRLMVERVISLAGPAVRRPRLLRTRLGAATGDLVADELEDGEIRVVSGSVLSGRTAMGETLGYLGRYHLQISALPEVREREFFGWTAPGADKFSVINTHVSKLLPRKDLTFTTSTHGSRRNIVPIGIFEKITPMDLMPTQLLKSLLMRDVETAEKLGCLELDEEDLALCTFACPGKNEYGPYLRDVLTTLEKEG